MKFFPTWIDPKVSILNCDITVVTTLVGGLAAISSQLNSPALCGPTQECQIDLPILPSRVSNATISTWFSILIQILVKFSQPWLQRWQPCLIYPIFIVQVPSVNKKDKESHYDWSYMYEQYAWLWIFIYKKLDIHGTLHYVWSHKHAQWWHKMPYSEVDKCRQTILFI